MPMGLRISRSAVSSITDSQTPVPAGIARVRGYTAALTAKEVVASSTRFPRPLPSCLNRARFRSWARHCLDLASFTFGS